MIPREPPLVYGQYTQRELDAQYDTSLPVGGIVEPYFVRFREASAEARQRLAFRMLRYGVHERETVDVVPATRPGSPLFLWVHGGYWRRMSKDDFSFVAARAVDAGAAAAIVNYPLAPEASLDRIVAAVHAACDSVLACSGELQADPARLVAGGHSVGAQLAGMLAVDFALHALFCLSGLYDLEPIRRSQINETIAMDESSASRNSPLHHRPRVPGRLVLACGGREQPEFHRQQHEYAAAWREWGGHAREVPAPRHDHFSIVLDLTDSHSVTSRALISLLK
ncbi:MAG: alpha/beta hydrolase [Candidatus Eremiobacteraeota bacterium]|nr:alpha/beta hydrolase [Candidatus Eremiobacteraeota bacterium]MBC5803340.1 alpha/beta hydrolase [Candidatus Eremiobacteraeota bacterium]MBC5822862.1 alpha/beta hydrolase [Candidatus Eremiobacteraeota bacterium]